MASSIFPPCDPRLVKAIREADSAAVIAHRNPDGDALYSSLAMAAILRKLGKKAILLNEGPFARDDIKMLEGLFSKEADPESLGINPLVIILDCSTPDRPGAPFTALQDLPRIVIDHHSSGVPFTEEGMSYIVPDSPSTTLLVDEVRIALSVELDKETAKYLMLGFLTDTGFFHFISEEQAPDSFKKISSFVATGLNPYELYDKLHDGRRLEDVKSVAKIIEESKAVLSGRVIIAYERKDYAGLERPGDSVYSNLLEVDGVKVVVLIKEREDAVEFGFRAKRDASVDVGKLASELSGGGHKLASGATVKGMKIEDAEPFIISKLETLVN